MSHHAPSDLQPEADITFPFIEYTHEKRLPHLRSHAHRHRLTGAPVDEQLQRSADVENAKPQGDADAGDDPEADHDGGFGPAGQLEVMLQRSHPEHPFAG